MTTRPGKPPSSGVAWWRNGSDGSCLAAGRGVLRGGLGVAAPRRSAGPTAHAVAPWPAGGAGGQAGLAGRGRRADSGGHPASGRGQPGSALRGAAAADPRAGGRAGAAAAVRAPGEPNGHAGGGSAGPRCWPRDWSWSGLPPSSWSPPASPPRDRSLSPLGRRGCCSPVRCWPRWPSRDCSAPAPCGACASARRPAC